MLVFSNVFWSEKSNCSAQVGQSQTETINQKGSSTVVWSKRLSKTALSFWVGGFRVAGRQVTPAVYPRFSESLHFDDSEHWAEITLRQHCFPAIAMLCFN